MAITCGLLVYIIKLFFFFQGSVISFALIEYYNTNYKKDTEELQKQLSEKDSLKFDFQTYRYETDIKILELKNQLEVQKQQLQKQ